MRTSRKTWLIIPPSRSPCPSTSDWWTWERKCNCWICWWSPWASPSSQRSWNPFPNGTSWSSFDKPLTRSCPWKSKIASKHVFLSNQADKLKQVWLIHWHSLCLSPTLEPSDDRSIDQGQAINNIISQCRFGCSSLTLLTLTGSSSRFAFSSHPHPPPTPRYSLSHSHRPCRWDVEPGLVLSLSFQNCHHKLVFVCPSLIKINQTNEAGA